MIESVEPLAESAPIASRFASQLCRKDPATGVSCAWSHGLWQYLRILGLVVSPDYHAEFYRQALGNVAGDGPVPRVLVSGAADYSMLAQVIVAFRARGIEPEVTVVDLCETPLALNRWYAGRFACRIATHCGAITAYAATAAFDAVCTDNFFGRFSFRDRPAVLAKWRALLRPGGTVVTVNRLRPVAASEPAVFTPAQAQAFRAAVLGAAEAMNPRLAVDSHELARQAEVYAGRHFSHSVRTLEELRGLFEDSEFRVEHIRSAPITAGSALSASGPSVRGDAEYAAVVAVRR